MTEKVVLCNDCQHCPAVEMGEDAVRIGEEGNLAVLTRAEWNLLVEKVKSGELKAL